MQRIATGTAVPAMFGAGKAGFSNGSRAAGSPATELSADWCNALQEEICRAVEGSGQALDPSRYDQLLDAIQRLAATAARVEPGRIEMTARAAAPDGWLLCQGQLLAAAEYPALYQAIGTTYGSGGAGTFRVPALSGRYALGAGAGYALGATGGSVAGQTDEGGDHAHGGQTAGHALTVAQLPAHRHGISLIRSNADGGAYVEDAGPTGTSAPASTDDTGGNEAHSHGLSPSGTHRHNFTAQPPYCAINYIIKV